MMNRTAMNTCPCGGMEHPLGTYAGVVQLGLEGTTLTGLCFHVTCPFFLADVNILYLFSMFTILLLYGKGTFFSDLAYLVFCKLLAPSQAYPSLI